MGRREPVALAIENDSCQQAWSSRSGPIAMPLIVRLELGLNLVPKIARHDPGMLAKENLASMGNFSYIDAILQDLV